MALFTFCKLNEKAWACYVTTEINASLRFMGLLCTSDINASMHFILPFYLWLFYSLQVLWKFCPQLRRA